MARMEIFIVLLICMIAQHISWAIPLADNDIANTTPLKSMDLCQQKSKYQNIEPSEKDNLLTPSNQLLKIALKAFQELSLQYAEKAKTISENLQKDAEILNSKTPILQEFKHNLTQFEEKYLLCDDIGALFDLVELYSNTTSFYYDLSGSTNLNDDSKLILSLLRKYGSEDLNNEFEKHFNIFVDNFDRKLEALKEELTKEEGKIGNMILEWYKTFKTLKAYDDKIVAFEKYFMFFEEENEDKSE